MVCAICNREPCRAQRTTNTDTDTAEPTAPEVEWQVSESFRRDPLRWLEGYTERTTERVKWFADRDRAYIAAHG